MHFWTGRFCNTAAATVATTVVENVANCIARATLGVMQRLQ